jgi:hypothetical protein
MFLRVHHELLLNDDALRGRQILFDKVTDEASVEVLSDSEYRDAHRAIGMLNTLAYYMKKGYVDEKDVMGLWAEALYRACRAAEPVINHRERRTGHRPWLHLEYLAKSTENYLAREGPIPEFPVWRRPERTGATATGTPAAHEDTPTEDPDASHTQAQ